MLTDQSVMHPTFIQLLLHEAVDRWKSVNYKTQELNNDRFDPIRGHESENVEFNAEIGTWKYESALEFGTVESPVE